MEKRPFFRVATAGLGHYCTGSYGQIGVYRVKGPVSRGDKIREIRPSIKRRTV